MSKHEELAKKVRILVGADKTDKAIDFLLDEGMSSHEKSLRSLESRFKRAKKAQLSGTIDNNSISIELNKINDSLLNLAKEIEDHPKKILFEERKKTNVKRIAIAGVVLLVISIGIYWVVSYSKENTKRIAETACVKKWNDCLKKGDVDMYKDFIRSKKCSNDSLEIIAKDSIVTINQRNAWNIAKTTNTFQSYTEFFSIYPDFNSRFLKIENLKPVVERKFIAFYRFDGNTKDIIGSNNGEGFSAKIEDKYNTDRFGKDDKVYMFNRSKYFNEERIEFSSPVISPFSKIYSISLWVKFTTEEDGGVLFGQFRENGHHGRYNHLTTLRPDRIGVDEFLPSGGGLSRKLSKSLKLGKWHHLVIARGPQTVFLYLNGDKIDEWDYDESYRGDDDDSGKDIKIALIGCRFSQGIYSGSFKGRIDDLGFSNTTLSEDEVKFIYAVQKKYED